jgi:membrane dipeptidase
MNKSALAQLRLICAFILASFQIAGARNSGFVQRDNPTTLIADAHVHIGLAGGEHAIQISDMEYFFERDIDAFIYAMPVDRSETKDLLSRITREVEQIRQETEKNANLSLTQSTAQIARNAANNEISLVLGIEYFHGVFGNNLTTIQAYKQLGIQYVTLMSGAEDGLFSGPDKLSDFGKKVIGKMNEVGILIDISHLSEEQMPAVIGYSKVPVMASHSASQGVAASNSTLSDGVLQALKTNQGYIMMTFNTTDLYGNEEHANSGIEQLIHHIDYIKQFVEIGHIGIGSDYQDGGKYIPADLNEKDVFQKIVDTMTERGYSFSEINGVLGGNILEALTHTEG